MLEPDETSCPYCVGGIVMRECSGDCESCREGWLMEDDEGGYEEW